MEPLVIAMVLAAAVMHAVWNAFIKIGGDRLMTLTVVTAMSGLLGPVLLFMGPPPAVESWPYIGLSIVIHSAYYYLLIRAYDVGDLSHAYPLARGSAPLLVAGGAAIFAGEVLGIGELVGVAVICAGIFSLMLSGRFGVRRDPRSILYPLATGVAIAAYTVADGIGVRLSGSPPGYIGWLFLLEAMPITLFALVRRRGAALVFLRDAWKPTLFGGAFSFGAYALVIWAMSLGAMAHVSALRETSVIIAALIGTRILGEPFGRHRVLAAATVAVGVVLLHTAA